MDNEEKVTMVRVLINNPRIDNETIGVYLSLAAHTILERMYPFKEIYDSEVPIRYHHIQCQLAARMILRRGTEGQLSQTENGVTRRYETVNDDDLLSEVMQVVAR